MVLLLSATLAISIVGLFLVLYLKHWELTTSRVVLGSVRPRIDHFFRTTLFWIERVIPALLRIYVKRATSEVLSFMHRFSATLLLHTEHMLEKTLHTLRHTTDVRRGVGEASAFLREVAEHKKKLLHAQHTHVRLHKE